MIATLIGRAWVFVIIAIIILLVVNTLLVRAYRDQPIDYYPVAILPPHEHDTINCGGCRDDLHALWLFVHPDDAPLCNDCPACLERALALLGYPPPRATFLAHDYEESL